MRPALDLRLYLVTDAALCGSRGVPATVAAAIEGGVTAVQLRDPDATGRELYELAVALRERLAGSGVALVVNNRLDIALASGADGVHLGQSDLPARAAREVAGPDFLIGWSVTTVDEAETAGRWPAGTVDYLGVGPVFATATKSDAAPPMGLRGLGVVCRDARVPCVAIGGIDETNATAVVAAGARGVAVVSAICAADDPQTAAARLRSAVMRG